MAGIKKVLNWFVTIETDEENQDVPKEAADPNPDVAAKAAVERAQQGPIGHEVNMRVGDVPTPSGHTVTEDMSMAALERELAAARTPPPMPKPPGSIDAMMGAPNPGNTGSFNATTSDLSIDEMMGGDSDVNPMGFEELYASYGLADPASNFTVFKIEELLSSPHLQGLPDSTKRASLLVALQASGVHVADLVADAAGRDQALDDHDANLRSNVESLKADIEMDNALIQEEMNQLLAEMQKKISDNNAKLQEATQTYLAWKQNKEREEQRLFNAISPFVEAHAPNPVSIGD